MREVTEFSITQAVIDRLKDAPDARFKEVMTSLVTHLHDFVRDVRLTEAEWIRAIEFGAVSVPRPAGETTAPIASTATIATSTAATRQNVSFRRIRRRSTMTSDSSDMGISGEKSVVALSDEAR